MRTLAILLLALLPLSTVPASGTANECVSVSNDVACDDVAVSVWGSASGGFLAVSGFDDANTYMDRCLEWVCPSVAVSGYRGNAYAECHASSACVAVAGFGHAYAEGAVAYAYGTCDWFYQICYPILA